MVMEIQRWWSVCESSMKSISLISGYLFLISAIITGVAANGYLKTTEGFTKLAPTIFCLISIIICMFSLSKAMSVIPVGFTYATYGALTITAVTLFGIFKYNQTPNIYGSIGIALIILGVILLNTLGKLK
jgi:small multidrug resistance pump